MNLLLTLTAVNFLGGATVELVAVCGVGLAAERFIDEFTIRERRYDMLLTILALLRCPGKV
jgi:hypothetical protein